MLMRIRYLGKECLRIPLSPTQQKRQLNRLFVKSNVMNGHVVITDAVDCAVSAPRVRPAVRRAYAKCQRLIAFPNVAVKHAAMMDVEASAVIVLTAHPARTLAAHKCITQPDSASLTTMRQIMRLLARQMSH